MYLFLIETLSDLFAKHIDVCFIDVPALVDQRNSVIDWNVLQLFLLLLPILIQDKQ